MLPVRRTLSEMAGERERCMYCLDSHGTDIEHFWPKAPFPEQMFKWPNLLLCCTECGRFKGDRFPLAGDQPLLIDPTAVNPWEFLDFDPKVGLLTARYLVQTGEYSMRGETTVELLRLDRREALEAGYKRTWKRLAAHVEAFLLQPGNAGHLPQQLLDSDDHGLLGWCIDGTGANEPPMSDLRERHPAVWADCEAAYRVRADTTD